MARTVNLGLYVTPASDMDTDVRSWINRVAGDDNASNMALIDAAFKHLEESLYQYVDTNSGMYAFHVDEHGDLILTYETDTMPPFKIDENGCLILTIRGASANLGKIVTAGTNGVTFTPYIDGTWLRWANDGGLPNPDPVDLSTMISIDVPDAPDTPEQPAQIELDKTLQREGMAADAKAVGDALNELSTNFDTALSALVGDLDAALASLLGIEGASVAAAYTVTGSDEPVAFNDGSDEGEL